MLEAAMNEAWWIAAALLAYLLHSSVLLGAAFLWLRPERGSAGDRARAWRLALCGGVLTTALQLGTGLGPSIDPFPKNEPPTFAVVDAPALASALPAGVALELGTPAATTERAAPSLRELVAVGAAALLAMGLGFALLRGARARASLARALRRRTAVDDPMARELLDELVRSAHLSRGVRLSQTPDLAVPIARGCLRPEIVLPTRALSELTRDELRAVLAHELAHVRRGDCLWLPALRAVRWTLFVQPGNGRAIRAYVAEAERAADELSVRWTGDPLALARALTRVASWLGPARRPSLVPAMADEPTTLSARIDACLRGRRPAAGVRRASPSSLVAVLPALVLGLPALAVEPSAPAPDARSVAALAEPDAPPSDLLDLVEAELHAAREEHDRLVLEAARTNLDTFGPRIDELGGRLERLALLVESLHHGS